MAFETFMTPAERCFAHPSGWGLITLSDGDWEVTRLPFVDSEAGLFARPDEEQSLIVAKREDAELINDETAKAIYRTGFKCGRAIIMRETAEEIADRLKRGVTNALEKMATKDWALRTDLEFLQRLAVPPIWDGSQLVAHPLKDWVQGTGCVNFGFFDPLAPNGEEWQTDGHKHNPKHTDYSQVLRLRRRPRS